jgi:flagellar basal-body rod protein FlgC
MPEGIFSSFKVSAMGLKAQRLRLDVAAENLANAETTRTPEGGPYRAKTVVFTARQERPPLVQPFARLLADATGLSTAGAAERRLGPELVASVAAVGEPFSSEYAPDHPDADARGVLLKPNVDPIAEMLNLIKATRAYEANATAMDAAKDMINRAIDL